MRHPHPLLGWIVGLSVIVLGVVYAVRLGQSHGWVGAIVGLLAPVVCVVVLGAAVIGAAWLWEAVRQAGPRYPPCHNGVCTGGRWPSLTGRDRGSYERAFVDGVSVLRCECGRTYVEQLPDRFLERLDDGSLRPYMVHRAFKGWAPAPHQPRRG